jgi:hypothetical protein
MNTASILGRPGRFALRIIERRGLYQAQMLRWWLPFWIKVPVRRSICTGYYPIYWGELSEAHDTVYKILRERSRKRALKATSGTREISRWFI